MPKIGCVIPVGDGREENLKLCLQSIMGQTRRPDEIVVVFDGPSAVIESPPVLDINIKWAVTPEKYSPGKEQPRNVGVWALEDCDAVWFVDSDVIVGTECLENLEYKWRPGRVVVGPYEWLPPGQKIPDWELFNDGRWPMFEEDRWKDPEWACIGDISVGLGSYSGNLLWDVPAFKRVGGFWNVLTRGEDGELGLRSVALGVPIQVEPDARGWHVWHEVNLPYILECNAYSVPLIDERHPWVQGKGIFMVDEDGKRFDQLCPTCNTLINTGAYWEHRKTCESNVSSS